MPSRLEKLFEYALRAVRRDYAARKETAPLLPDTCPYTWEDIQGRGADWVPSPRA